jgi:hypothetical protein
MRFFASWWERFPVREAGPIVVGLAFAFGLFPQVAQFIAAFARASGSIWGD